jgi:hypothetical protein
MFYCGFQNYEKSWIRRWLWKWETIVCGLVKSRSSINYSKVFAKIGISLPFKFVNQHLPDSRLIAPTSTNSCNHRGIIQTRYEYHSGFLGHFSWTDARVSRIELSLWKMMSSIILLPEHPQNDEWSELLGKTQILPEKLIQEGCWTVNHFCYGFCHFALCFGITSHPLTKHVFLCLFVVLKAWDVSFKGYFDKIFWSSSNMQLRLINPED